MEEEELWKGLEHLEGGVEHPEGGSGRSLEREGYRVGCERTSHAKGLLQLANPGCLVYTYNILLPKLILINMHCVEASNKIRVVLHVTIASMSLLPPCVTIA